MISRVVELRLAWVVTICGATWLVVERIHYRPAAHDVRGSYAARAFPIPGLTRLEPTTWLRPQRGDAGHLGSVGDVSDGHREMVRVGVALGTASGFGGAPGVQALRALQHLPDAGHRRGVQLVDGVVCAARADHVGSHGIPFPIGFSGWRRAVGAW